MKSVFLKNLIKTLAITFSLLFVMYLSVLVVFPKKFNIQKFKTQLEQEIHNQTGLTAGIENISVKPSFSTPHHIFISR